jgi:hypothetical protein
MLLNIFINTNFPPNPKYFVFRLNLFEDYTSLHFLNRHKILDFMYTHHDLFEGKYFPPQKGNFFNFRHKTLENSLIC